MLSSILFPLRTNINSLQRWGDSHDISGRIKQSMILYHDVIVETGTFRYSGSDRFAFYEYKPWSEENTLEKVLKGIERIERRSGEGYFTVIDGKTRVEKYKYAIKKKQEFVADYRTVDVISEIESGSYGKEADFLKYALIQRKKSHKETLSQNTNIDLTNKEFVDTARKTYGEMNLVGLLHNLNDSLALSHLFKIPISLDAIHTPLLRAKRKAEVGFEFEILDRLTQIAIPDFSKLELDDLLKLRKDKAIESFRDMIWKINSKIQLEGSSNIEELFNQELLNEVAEIAPTEKELALNVALGALSFIPVPLVSVAAEISDLGKDLKEYKDFAKNWLSFVLKARELDRSQYKQ